MQSITSHIVSHFTGQLKDRVLRFPEKLEESIVPPFAERAELATQTGWDTPAKIAKIDAALTHSRIRNVVSARAMYVRDQDNVRQFSAHEPLDLLQGCLDKLFDHSNFPHPYHPLFPVSLAQTYGWASSIVDHWPEIRKSPERAAAVQRRAEQFMSGVLEMPGVSDRVGVLELQSRFLSALHAPVHEKAIEPEPELTVPQRIWGEIKDTWWQAAFVSGFGDENALLRQGRWSKQRR